ncbi:MAG TPA: DUF3090 family protein [Ktedonobacteraceae bacterium]
MSTRDLGAVDVLGVEAIGQPGQRRFRLFARTKAYSAILWMEKVQLLDLSQAIDSILAQASEGRILRVEARANEQPGTIMYLPDDFPMPSDYDFQVGQLRLTFESERAVFILAAVPFEIAENEQGEPQLYLQDEDVLSFQFSLEQARDLTSHIITLASSGRPVCPLCHAPLDGGPHACDKQNGHRKIIQIIKDDEEED